MEDRVYQTAIHDVDEMKQRLIATIAHMKQSVINKAIIIDDGAQGSRRVFVPRDNILNICFVEHEHYFFACLAMCLRNFINVAEIAKTTLYVPVM